MREVGASDITNKVTELYGAANRYLPTDIEEALKRAALREDNKTAKEVLAYCCRNAEISKETGLPICQDTGMAAVFLEIGQDVHITGGDVCEAVNKGIGKACLEYYLRPSVVCSPLGRKNSGNNTPAVIYTTLVVGDTLKITVIPKGFGSENMSKIKMFNPTASSGDIIDFIVGCVREAGGNPCPPIVVGVGIGGTFDYAAYLSKKALCRPINIRNDDPLCLNIETTANEKINALNIGAGGLGGRVTALAVNVEQYATHIAGLPVAVNISCHATRHKTGIV